MKSKPKKILIIGIGSMGISHFNSFINSKSDYDIYLCDKRINQLKKNINNLIIKKKLNFLSKVPKNHKFDLAIISTNSKERLKILKYLLKFNLVKNLILEKFLFNKINYYSQCEDILKNKKIQNVNVNSWGNSIFKKLNFKLNGNFTASYHLRKNGLGSNLIHISDLFSSLIKNEDFDIKGLNLIKVKSKRRKGYNEITGRIVLKSKIGLLKIHDTSKTKYHTLKIKDERNSFVLQLNNKKKCYFFKNKKLIKTFIFPFAKDTTEKIFLKFINNKTMMKNDFNNYYNISLLSKKIILFIKSKFKNFNLT